MDYEFSEEMMVKLMPKLNYPVLLQAAKSVGLPVDGLPASLAEDWKTNPAFLRSVGELVMSVEVVEGELECPETGRRFLIREGIPNMLVNEEEKD